MTSMFNGQCIMAIFSFLGSLFILVSFLVTANRTDEISEDTNNSGTKDRSTTQSAILAILPQGLDEQQRNSIDSTRETTMTITSWGNCLKLHPYRPPLSTLVSFIAIAICFRSLANLFAIIGYQTGNHSGILCTLEAILRTYAALSSIISVTLIPIQYYAELFMIKGNNFAKDLPPRQMTYIQDRYLHKIIPYLINCSIKKECSMKFRTLLYHVVFVWPLVMAFLPLVSTGYGLHNEGLQRCTFRQSIDGQIWAIITLFVWICLSWIIMLFVYSRVQAKDSLLHKNHVKIRKVLFLYVVISIICWLPLFIGVVGKISSVFRYWEIVIQTEGLLYACVFGSIIYIHPDIVDHSDMPETRLHTSSALRQSIELTGFTTPFMTTNVLLQPSSNTQQSKGTTTARQSFTMQQQQQQQQQQNDATEVITDLEDYSHPSMIF